MFDGLKAVVCVPHIPVQVLQPAVVAEMPEESGEHLQLEIVIVLLYLVERDTSVLRDQMNSKRYGLRCIVGEKFVERFPGGFCRVGFGAVTAGSDL